MYHDVDSKESEEEEEEADKNPVCTVWEILHHFRIITVTGEHSYCMYES